MKNPSKVDLKSQNVFSENGKPLEHMKAAGRQYDIKVLEDNRKYCKELLCQLETKPDRVFLTLLSKLIRNVIQDEDFLPQNAEKLSYMLPMMFRCEEFVSFAIDERSELDTKAYLNLVASQRKEIDRMIKQSDCLRSCAAYLQFFAADRIRSFAKKTTDYPARYVSKQEWQESVVADINAAYGIYYGNLQFYQLPGVVKPTCSGVAKRNISLSPWRFPIQAALFAADAVDVSYGRSARKKDQVLEAERLRIPTDRLFWNNSAYYAALDLADRCQSVLAERLSEEYAPTWYPTQKDFDVRYHFSWENCHLGASLDEPNKHNEAANFNRNIPFALPICKTRTLALKIGEVFSLRDEITQKLIEDLPAFLYCHVTPRAKILETYGKKILDIISVFHVLTNPDFYNLAGENATGITESVIKETRCLLSTGFLPKPLKTHGDVRFFLNEYFYYDDITELIFAMRTHLLPDFRFGSISLKYYKKLKGSLKKRLLVFHPYSKENSIRRFDLPALNEKFSALPINRILKEIMTVDLALSFWDICVINPPENMKALKQSLYKLLGQVDQPHEQEILSQKMRSESQVTLIYKLLFESAVEVICQVCTAILWEASMQTFCNWSIPNQTK